MSEFQFAKGQRVVLPAGITGAEGVQAVVVGYHAKLGREPLYDLQWQASSLVDEHFNLVTQHATLSESAIIVAQPPKMIPLEEAENMVVAARENEREACSAKYRAAMNHVGRLEAAAKRRRKTSRSRKRR